MDQVLWAGIASAEAEGVQTAVGTPADIPAGAAKTSFEDFIGVNPWTALFILLNTLAIFFVARKYLFRPVHDMIEKRQREIDGLYEDAGKAKADAEAMAETYRGELAKAQETSDRLVQEATKRGRAREREIIRDANAQADAILEKAAEDIEQQKKKAVNEAKSEISSMAVSIAEKVVGRELTGADQADLVDEFIDRLGDQA